jgi:hypothetical protein
MSVIEHVEVGEVVSDLDYIAARIHSEYRAAEDAENEAFEHHLAVGRLLLEARRMLPAHQAYGAWFRAQGFGFHKRWALVLRQAAEHEDEVREAVRSQLRNGERPSIERAAELVCPPVPRALPPSNAPKDDEPPEEDDEPPRVVEWFTQFLLAIEDK